MKRYLVSYSEIFVVILAIGNIEIGRRYGFDDYLVYLCLLSLILCILFFRFNLMLFINLNVERFNLVKLFLCYRLVMIQFLINFKTLLVNYLQNTYFYFLQDLGIKVFNFIEFLKKITVVYYLGIKNFFFLSICFNFILLFSENLFNSLINKDLFFYHMIQFYTFFLNYFSSIRYVLQSIVNSFGLFSKFLFFSRIF